LRPRQNPEVFQLDTLFGDASENDGIAHYTDANCFSEFLFSVRRVGDRPRDSQSGSLTRRRPVVRGCVEKPIIARSPKIFLARSWQTVRRDERRHFAIAAMAQPLLMIIF